MIKNYNGKLFAPLRILRISTQTRKKQIPANLQNIRVSREGVCGKRSFVGQTMVEGEGARQYSGRKKRRFGEGWYIMKQIDGILVWRGT